MRMLAVILAIGCAALYSCSNDQITDPGNGSNLVNRAPLIHSLSADINDVAAGGAATLSCQAVDPDGDGLDFAWYVTGGTISSDGSSASWRAPETNGEFWISVIVSDGCGACDTAAIAIKTHKNPRYKILVDASRDGGVWWCPQYEATGFSATEPHQGKRLADYFRQRGFEVDELPRGTRITKCLLNQYDRVLVANGKYYEDQEFRAYDDFVERRGSVLILASEYLRPGSRDHLAERYGIPFAGIAYGTIARFAEHPLTAGVHPCDYIAGSAVLDPAANPNIETLGWLSAEDYVDLDNDGTRDPEEPYAPAVMGVLYHPTAKIFFIGDLNCLEKVHQPLIGNLVSWIDSEE